MTASQAMFSITTMCKTLGVSRSGFYAWRERAASARSKADAALTARIRAIHKASSQTYGAPRIHAELVDDGVRVGRKRVERLMKAAGIAGVSRRKSARTTARDERLRPASDLVDRNFHADEPNRLWVADITYVPTWAGFLYLAVVLDAFSRRIVGWAMGHDLKAQLVLDAMNMALTQRRPVAVIHHSDQGSQGEFKRSSQHLDGGGCDEQTEAALGSGRTSAFVLAGKTADCRARRTGTLLDGDCGGLVE